MVAAAGRDLRIMYDSGGGAAVIAGAQTDNFTINREAIDVTDKDDAAWRTYIADLGTISIDATVEGILVDDTLMALAANNTPAGLFDFEIDVAALGTFSGSWHISSFEASGAEGTEAITFTCAIQSGGAVTYTAD